MFRKISFGVAEGQRIGLIAKNGTGKTTLLNIIAGKEGYDEGSIVFRRDLRVGYLEQDPHYPEDLTVLEACFYHGNSTVELIKEYESCMETEGNPGLEELLARMEHEKAWIMNGRRNKSFHYLNPGFQPADQTSFRRSVETGGFGECADNRARFPDFGRAYQPS